MATIRRARGQDAPAIGALHARWIADAFVGLYTPSSEVRAARERSWTGPVGAPWPRHSLLVAERSGRVVAFAAIGPTRDSDNDRGTTGELDIIIVDGAERGAGIGSALITAAQQAMSEEGFVTATLWVLPENTRAVRTYERCGWRPDGTESTGNFGGRHIRMLRYRKHLMR